MPSALSQFRDATKPNAVFTGAWPSPLVINGNTGSTVLKAPPDLRVVRRVTSSAIYYAKGDGSEVRGDFPKAYLIEKVGGAFLIYDPKMTTSGEMKEIPGERGRLNRVYFQGDVRKELECNAALLASRLGDGAPGWGVQRISETPAREGYGPSHVLHLISAGSGGSSREVRLSLTHDGRPYSVFCVEQIKGVPFEFPLSSQQAAQVLGGAIYGGSDASVLRDLPVAWGEFVHAVKAKATLPSPTPANDAPLPSASSSSAQVKTR
jgi:hypothetical protein